MDCLGGGRQINCIDVELVLCAAVIVGFPLGTIENQLCHHSSRVKALEDFQIQIQAQV